MHHCVRTYAARCAKGKVSVWSLGAEVGAEALQKVLTIAVDNEKKQVSEFRGKYNMLPNDKKRSARQQEASRPLSLFAAQVAGVFAPVDGAGAVAARLIHPQHYP
jgi:hypothetical protein